MSALRSAELVPAKPAQDPSRFSGSQPSEKSVHDPSRFPPLLVPARTGVLVLPIQRHPERRSEVLPLEPLQLSRVPCVGEHVATSGGVLRVGSAGETALYAEDGGP